MGSEGNVEKVCARRTVFLWWMRGEMRYQTGNLVACVSQAAFFSLGVVCVIVAVAFWLYFVAAALLSVDCAVFAGGGIAGLAAGAAALVLV